MSDDDKQADKPDDKGEKEQYTFDPDQWTGGDDGERYKQMFEALGGILKNMGKGTLEAAFPFAVPFAVVKAAGGTIPHPAALAIFAYSNFMRTRKMLADRHNLDPEQVEVMEVLTQMKRNVVDEYNEASIKTAVEFASADKDGDGKISLREIISTMLDVAGNYLPGASEHSAVRGTVLDAAETAAGWMLIDNLGALRGEAIPDATSIQRAVVDLGLTIPAVAGQISVSKRDERWLRECGATGLGALLYDWLGFDGKIGPGGDDCAKGVEPEMVTPKAATPRPLAGMRPLT